MTPFPNAIESIAELDQDCRFSASPPTLRDMLGHFARFEQAKLDFPIILNEDGSLMDGGHRIYKALLQGQETIQAVKFETMPQPDEIVEIM